MTNRTGIWAKLLLIVSCNAIPLLAFEGNVQDITFNAVTCLNHTTGAAVVGLATETAFDCSALETAEGDTVGVVLLGTASAGTPGGEACTSPQEVQEVEPNDLPDQAQILNQTCVSIRAERRPIPAEMWMPLVCVCPPPNNSG